MQAVELEQEINPDKKRASSAMITFLVLNTSGVTIIPTTIISLRLASGSIDPTSVIPTCIIATTCSTIAGLTLDYIVRRRHGNN